MYTTPQPGELCRANLALQDFAQTQRADADVDDRLAGPKVREVSNNRRIVADEAEALRAACGACTLIGVYNPPAGVTGCPNEPLVEQFIHNALEERIYGPSDERRRRAEQRLGLPRQEGELTSVCVSGQAAYAAVATAQRKLADLQQNYAPNRERLRELMGAASGLLATATACRSCHYGGDVREGKAGTDCPNADSISERLKLIARDK